MSLQKKRILFVLVGVLFFMFAAGVLYAYAQNPPSGGLVPCGNIGQTQCNLCHLYELGSRIINFLLYGLALPAATIAFLIGGILMLTSRGNPKQLEMGKAALGNAVIGVIIAFAAWLIINTILMTLVQGGEIKFAQALPWNKFPSCLAPISAGPGALPREACDTKNGPFSRACKAPSGEDGIQACGEDGFWDSTCLVACTAAELNTKRDCSIGGCPGQQTCTSAPPAGYFWSECTPKDPATCPPRTGTCTVMQTGYCAVSSLSCFGAKSAEASQVCMYESAGGHPDAQGDATTVQGTSERVWRSHGLFQINLTVHTVNGLPCRNAFTGRNGQLKNDAASRELYNNCVAAARIPTVNIQTACRVFHEGQPNWHEDWTRTANACHLQ